MEDRIYRHNNSGSKSTKKAKDWSLAYCEKYGTKSLAVVREREIKSKKSRQFIKELIDKSAG